MWESHVRETAQNAVIKDLPINNAIRAIIVFQLKKPKKPKAVYPITKPDVDNLVKAVLDGMNGVLYADDSQIIDLRVVKAYADGNPKTLVTLEYCE